MIYRLIEATEYEALNDFLYEAIFIPDGAEPPPHDVILTPSLNHYIKDFGRVGDCCFVCEDGGQIVGAAWSRILDEPECRGYGNIGGGIPELAISVLPEYRNCGIGTKLLNRLHSSLSAEGYERISLSVQKANPALRLYERNGYETIKAQDEELIMVKHLGLCSRLSACTRTLQ
ncbi:MAG: GNAT family N-acetyltransferase [Clostridiales Family XIII bacterium]|jgi:ribosomal protein S18 acetylase RimI-like enzyme|nr:GNAT family N-acetyltransferase [Clostridiales Family XIII bacterium]